MIKGCARCHKIIPLAEYYRQHKTGYYSVCKICCNERSKLNYEANRTYYLALSVKWKQTPEGKLCAHMNYLGRKAKGLTSLCAERFRSNSKGKNAAISKRYKQTAKGKACKRREEAKRRMKKRQGVTMTHLQWEEVLASYNHRCAYCGINGKFTQDHYIPLISGGTHTKENIVPACLACNQRKHTKHPHLLFRI